MGLSAGMVSMGLSAQIISMGTCTHYFEYDQGHLFYSVGPHRKLPCSVGPHGKSPCCGPSQLLSVTPIVILTGHHLKMMISSLLVSSLMLHTHTQTTTTTAYTHTTHTYYTRTTHTDSDLSSALSPVPCSFYVCDHCYYWDTIHLLQSY